MDRDILDALRDASCLVTELQADLAAARALLREVLGYGVTHPQTLGLHEACPVCAWEERTRAELAKAQEKEAAGEH